MNYNLLNRYFDIINSQQEILRLTIETTTNINNNIYEVINNYYTNESRRDDTDYLNSSSRFPNRFSNRFPIQNPWDNNRYRPTTNRYRPTTNRYRPTTDRYRPTTDRYRPTTDRNLYSPLNSTSFFSPRTPVPPPYFGTSRYRDIHREPSTASNNTSTNTTNTTNTGNFGIPNTTLPPLRSLSHLQPINNTSNLTNLTNRRRTAQTTLRDFIDNTLHSAIINSHIPTRGEIDNATTLIVSNSDVTTLIETTGQTICPIDREIFQEGDSILRINYCGHIFRENNLREWFGVNPMCPMCRYNIITNGYDNSNNTSNTDISRNNIQTQTSYNLSNTDQAFGSFLSAIEGALGMATTNPETLTNSNGRRVISNGMDSIQIEWTSQPSPVMINNSGNTTDFSGNTTDLSGNTTDFSGNTTDLSGNTTDLSGNT